MRTQFMGNLLILLAILNIDEIIQGKGETEKRTLIDVIWYLGSLKKKDIT